MKKLCTFGGGLAALAALALATGCSGPSGTGTGAKGGAKAAKGSAEEHAAHGPGPHGGTVADWGGGKYHVEFTVDHGKQEATVYILGADEKTPAPIKAAEEQLLLNIQEPAFQVTLKAAPQQEDPPGLSSRFVGQHEKLGKEQEFAGTIVGAADGTPYTGDFKEEPEGTGAKTEKK